jgi:hypothetical protein
VQVQVPNGDATGATVAPITANITGDIPSGSNLIVEVDAANGESAGNFFYLGASAGGETHPGYIKSSSSVCGATVPTSFAFLGHPENSILLSASGTQ